MAKTFVIWAADTSALTGPPTNVASSAVSGTKKTVLQVKPIVDMKIIGWMYTLDAVPAAPPQIELVETGTVAATVTTIGSGIIPYDDANAVAASNYFTASTTATGFNASAEGTITASKLYDYQYENALYFKNRFELGREPGVKGGNILRVRITPTSAVAVNIMAGVVVEV